MVRATVNSEGLKVSIYTLGCRLNQADSAQMADALSRHDCSIVPWGQDADAFIINSCSVTAAAAAKTRKTARAVRRKYPEAFIAVVGCDVDVDVESWRAQSAVDLLVGNADKGRLYEWLAAVARGEVPERVQRSRSPDRGPRFREQGTGLPLERTRANLKIQEGCSLSCTYCIVPSARGPARSRDWDDVLREADQLARRGIREIVLTGVNIATYADRGRNLADLLEALLGLGGSFRIRLSSTEPGPVLPDLIDVMAGHARVCRFLHLPLQHGDDRILRAMNRHYDVQTFAAMVARAVTRIPGIRVGTDIIVGFPGETDAMFEHCRDTVESVPVNHLHVFTFSPREGTPAARLPDQVPGDVASARARNLTAVGKVKAEHFLRSQIGAELQIITEQRNAQGKWEGWSDNYLRVVIEDSDELHENALVSVRIERVQDDLTVSGCTVPS